MLNLYGNTHASSSYWLLYEVLVIWEGATPTGQVSSRSYARKEERERERDSTFRDENESEKEAGVARHKQEKGECDTGRWNTRNILPVSIHNSDRLPW